MLETSRDFLNIILGISIFTVAALFAWVLYQTGRAIKGANDIIARVKDITDMIHEGVKTIKDKSGHVATYIDLLVKGGQEVLKQIQKRKTKKTGKRKSQSK